MPVALGARSDGAEPARRLVVAVLTCATALVIAGTLVPRDAGGVVGPQGARPVGSMDARFCRDYGQATHGSYGAVLACDGPSIGPIFFQGTRGRSVETDLFGFQCVELVDRYLYAFKGWPTELWDGADLVRVYAAAHRLAPVKSGNAAGLVPRPGDVISFSVFSNFTDHDHAFPGHTAIVVATGRTFIETLNENWNGGASLARLPRKGTTIEPIYTDSARHGLVLTRYSEWLPITIAAPKAGYGPFYVTGGTSRGLAVHAAPTTASTVTGFVAKGTAVRVACQAVGTAYPTGAAPSLDSIWERLTGGGYVEAFRVTAPVPAALSPGMARC